jgi:DNA-binding MarR family transcriptional regulator
MAAKTKRGIGTLRPVTVTRLGTTKARAARSTPATSFDLDGFLPYRLAVLAETVSRAFSSVYRQQFGLSVAEWRILANLTAKGPLTAGEVAARSNLDKPKVTRALGRLTSRGLIVRSVGERDRRKAHIRVSATGARLFRQIAPLALEWEHQLLGALTKDQHVVLARSLDALNARAHETMGAQL